jgi:zinc transport system ATP-binding protein
MAESTTIEVSGLAYRYPRQRGDTLNNVGFEIGGTDWVGLLGPNGGGKTTLLKLLLGQLSPRTGRIEILATTPRRARHRVGYVPQDTTIDPNVPASVLDIVLLGRLRGSSWGPRYSSTDHALAWSALRETETDDLANRPWRTLSGGQRQRVLIARALASEVNLLLLDEPTTGIDTHREKALLHLLERLNQRLPILMVSHDTALVSHHMDRALWVDGSLREIDTSSLDPGSLEELFHGHAS